MESCDDNPSDICDTIYRFAVFELPFGLAAYETQTMISCTL